MSDLLGTVINFAIAWAGGFFVAWMWRGARADEERWARDDAEYEEMYGAQRRQTLDEVVAELGIDESEEADDVPR